jgi:hypothetical protein
MVGAVHSIPVGNTVGNTSPGVARFLNYEKAGPWGDEEGGAGVSLRGDELVLGLTPCIPLVHL